MGSRTGITASPLRVVSATFLLLSCATPGWAQAQAPASPPAQDSTVLPPVTVTGSVLKEVRRVGSNRQPEWSTERRFPSTRLYVLPPGMIQFEPWWRGTYHRDGTKADRFLSEISIGLPNRWQLDLYGRFEGETGSSTRYVGEQIEVRYALAEWGRIPANPTLYAEFKRNDHGPEVVKAKLLLGDELRHGWRWAANLSYETETGGSREIERALTFGISKTIKDSRFGLGIEGVLEHVTAHGSSSETAFLIGPSFQWRPSSNVRLDAVPLIGTTHDSPDVQVYVVLGITLRNGERSKVVNAPISAAPR